MTQNIILTEAAIQATTKLMAENAEYRQRSLRLYLAGKGCDGFDYGVSFDDPETGDQVFTIGESLKLLCDERSFEFVKGSTIDWVDDERGRGYVVSNPNHRKFRGKFYKKESWKTRLTAENN